MSNHSTAELHPGALHEEAQQQNLRIMIESMVRAGYTEPEITQAVETATAPAPRARPSGRASHALLGLFRR
jgi:hypothetical protein